MKQIILLVFAMVVCGCATIAPTPKALLELRLADTSPGRGLSEMAFPGSSQPVFLSNVPVIRNADIAYAEVTTYSDAPAVAITFIKSSAIKFCDITSANIGKPMGVLVDGKLVNVATIRERFCGGKAIITGNFSVEEAKRIAAAFPDGPADALTAMSVWQGTGDGNIEDRIEGILRERIDHYQRSVGIVVGLVDERGTTVVGYGKLARDDHRRPDGDTVFEIGSVTKVFTSLLLADLVERGKLGLDDPVAKYLPESATLPSQDGRPITLVHLATHTSGLPPMPDNYPPEDPANPYPDYTVEQMYAFLSGYTPTRPVGEESEYSNLGVGLLGHVLARQAGMDYEKLVRERITQPLGMRDTGVRLTAEQQARLAKGHDADLEPASNSDIVTLAGAGALRATTNDLLKFAAANLGLIESKLSSAMHSTHRARHRLGPPGLQIGLGWMVQKTKDGEILWHNGGTGGYHSFLGIDKKKRTGVVVLSNASQDIDDIGLHLLDDTQALAVLDAPRQVIAVDAAIYDAYLGDYQLAPGFVIAVTREGARLFTQATGQPKIEVFPESATKFFAKVVDAQISFVQGREGKIEHLVLHQGGFDQKAKRLGADGQVDFSPGPSVSLPAQILDRYVGEYRLEPGIAIAITLDGDRLLAQATRQPPFEIFAGSETKFFYKVMDAHITFNIDAEARVTGLVLHQGGRDLPAPRID